MRWSATPILLAVLAASRSVTAQSVQGAPTEGAQSVPVMDGATATAVPRQQGVPSSVLASAESVPVTYNNGLYTPWTPTSQAEVTQASVEETQATTQAPVTVSPASSIYLQPTTLASPAVTSDILSTDTAETSETSTELSTSIASSTTPSSTSSSLPTTSSTSTISFASRSTRSSTSTVASATSVNDKANVSTGSDNKMVTVLPVALSLGVLALLLAILLFFVWRRRQRKRRMLESRRYNDDDTEKAGFRYAGGANDDDDYMEDEEKGPGAWTTFQQTPRYNDVEKGSGMAGLGSAASPIYRMNEQHQSAERGWQWGTAEPRNVLKQSRGPLPNTPQAASNDLQRQDTLESLHADLDAMIAESRTGYEPRQTSENTGSALGRTASAIYSSLSGRGKRFGSRASSRSAYSSGPGSWNEHGVWELEADLNDSETGKKRASLAQESSEEERGQGRPLLACVDETPRKKGYSTYTPPESPSRNSGHDRQAFYDDDTAMTVAGGSSMQYSLSDSATALPRGVTLRDNPVPAFSPSSAGGAIPRRWRSKTLSQSDCDSPSLYSPSVSGHGAFSPPTALQPGKSPAVGSRPASPAIQGHPYYKAYNQPSNAPLTQSTKSGTTYSLSGMAGLLYSKDAPQNDDSYTNLPPRKPRRKSTLAKTRPDIPGVTVTPAASDNPHRAVSRVIQQSRARGSSFSSQSSDSSAPKEGWNSRVRSDLRESHSSGSSIDELLNNVLGTTRSPA